jgi:uncharacterized repeat protein (TIGR03943 family)
MSSRHRNRQDWRRWNGIVLCACAIVATVWLAATNQLLLYIHPRYIVFTVIMAALGLALLVGSLLPAAHHDHEDAKIRRSGLRRALTGTATVVTAVVALALVIVPPTTLTSATADQRDVNSTGVLAAGQPTTAVASISAGSSENFTVRDWASLLRQTTDPGFYSGKPAHVVGFVTPDKDDPANVFYVTRFVITCCAVDAQPIGVPVYLADWADEFHKNDWVEVTGSFGINPSRSSNQPIVIIPTSTTATVQPDEPYLY